MVRLQRCAPGRYLPSGLFVARSEAEGRDVEGPADGDEISWFEAAPESVRGDVSRTGKKVCRTPLRLIYFSACLITIAAALASRNAASSFSPIWRSRAAWSCRTPFRPRAYSF